MIAALDSSFTAPSAAQADAAAAAGVRVWAGYLATRAGVGLAAPWTDLAFMNAKRCGGQPLAFASGWDDPAACRAAAAAWGVRLVLDCEDGIRGLGSWSQGWLDASGAGLYGGAHVHGLRAPFHVIARYPGFDPRATWPADVARPAGPVGWQWQGTHAEFGASVDRSWLDDWFGGGEMTVEEHALLVAAERRSAQIFNLLVYGDTGPVDDQGTHFALEELPLLRQILAATGQPPPAPGGGGDFSSVLSQLQALGKHLGVDVTTGSTS